MRLRFRAPGRPQPAGTLLARALPDASAADRQRWIERGALRRARLEESRWRAGPRLHRSDETVAPGTALWMEASGRLPALRLPVGRIQALLPALPWRAGAIPGPGGELAFHVAEEQGRLCRVIVDAGTSSCRALLEWAASAGSPVLGDVVRGGVLVEGGLRVAAADARLDWPREAVFPPSAERSGREEAVLAISTAAARALRRGHPWLLADPATGDAGRWPAGSLVALAAPSAGVVAHARIEADPPLLARVWSLGGAAGGAEASLEGRVHRALARREAFNARAERPEGTDAYRLVHGEADAIPGLAVDRLGPVLRMIVAGRAALPLRERVADTLRSELADVVGVEAPVVEVMVLRHPPPGRLLGVRQLRGDPDHPALRHLQVREGVLRFRLDLGLGDPTRPRPGVGLFLDQRANRARLARRVRPGGRYLNLFAHTGAFSAALLAAGAEAVTSVDLSAAYLEWLETNLKQSGLALERHQAVRRDARRFLEALPPELRFDGIIVDPPTAAAAGQRFWSVRQGIGPLLALALAHLAPGGWLLAARNDRLRRGGLRVLLEEIAADAGVPLAHLEDAPPAEDFPRLLHFPEGDPFEAVLLERA